MRRLRCIVGLGLAGCSSAPAPEIVEPRAPTVEVTPGVGSAEPADDPVVTGGFRLPGPRDWPCEIAQTLADGGGEEVILFDYTELDGCLVPADYLTWGLLGCAQSFGTYRYGVDRARYVTRMRYDAQRRLTGIADREEGELNVVRWSGGLVEEDESRGARVYQPTPDGFEVRQQDEVVVQVTLEGDRPVRVERIFRFPTGDRRVISSLSWEGRRVVRIEDDGGDVMVPHYDCVAPDPTTWEDGN